MPFRSQAQSRLMHAAAQDPAVAKSTGVPTAVAEKFVSEGHGQKVGKLPQHKKPPGKGQFSLPRERRK